MDAPKTPAYPPDQYEAIRRRAEEIYIRKGSIPGHDVEDWAQAEQEILRASSASTTTTGKGHRGQRRRRAIYRRVTTPIYPMATSLASSVGAHPCPCDSAATRCSLTSQRQGYWRPLSSTESAEEIS